jgi:catechol 2,3-dioxygenase-like lactoylglutathione lyase family enzyme
MSETSKYDAFIPFYPVHDLAATRDFYQRELGLELERDEARCLIFRAADGYLGFCLFDGPLPSHEGLTLSLVAPDVDVVYQRLRRLGVEIELPPRRDEHYRIYHFFARDPDAYRVEVRQFIEPLHG